MIGKINIYLIFIQFLTFPYLAYSQTYTGKIIDNEKNTPIPYASILFHDAKNGTYSNEKGEFGFSSEKKMKFVIVSAIGYSTDTIYTESLSLKDNLIRLKSDNIEINEVTVLSKKVELSRLKWNNKLYNRKKNSTFKSTTQKPGFQMAIEFHNKNYSYIKLKEILIKTKRHKNNSKIRLRAVTNLSANSTDLFTPIIIDLVKNKKNIRADIKKSTNVQRGMKYYILIEWIEVEKSDKKVSPLTIYTSIDSQETKTYFNFMNTKWNKNRSPNRFNPQVKVGFVTPKQ